MSYLEIRAPFNKLKVESAEDLWSHFMAYRNHSLDNPIVEPKIFCGKEGVIHGSLDKVRPLTLNGLCNYIGIHPGTWDGWKKKHTSQLDGSGDFFLDVMLQIESIIYDDQFQGAAVDIFNATVISRKLGLAEKQETSNSVSIVVSQEDAEL